MVGVARVRSSLALAMICAAAATLGCASGEADEVVASSPYGSGLPTVTTTDANEESGDDPGMSGDGDGDPAGDGDGDGDGDTTSSGDGDGDGDTSPGDGDGDGDTSGDGDGDTTSTGDGDGDATTTGDGDGDMMNAVWIESFEDMAYPPGWTSGGDAIWAGDQNEVHDGLRSARSGNIDHSSTTWAEVNVSYQNAGQIRFWYKVSSEQNYDQLQFSIDGVLQDEWSGSVGWSQVIYDVGAGNHTFRWAYSKDITVSSGSDRAWVDYVEFDVGVVNN